MAENKKYNHELNEIIRYKKNKMSNEERYEFECSLERDPFLAEAYDGFIEVSTVDIERDLNSINLLTGKQRKKIRPLIYLSVAASILILLVSVFFISKSDDKNAQLTAEVVKIEKDANVFELDEVFAFDSTAALPIDSTKILLADAAISMSTSKSIDKKATPTSTFASAKKNTIESRDDIRNEGKNREIPKRTMVAMVADNEVYIEPVIVKDSVFVEKTKATIENPIKSGLVSSEQETELSEELQDQAIEQNNSNRIGDNAKPEPIGGNTLFKDYLDKNLNYPSSIENAKREVVRIQFSVLPSGEITNFVVLKSPDNEAFANEVIRVLKNGSKWSPAVKNGNPIQDDVSLRIVFKP